jgi:hypothetical protein
MSIKCEFKLNSNNYVEYENYIPIITRIIVCVSLVQKNKNKQKK